MSFTEPQSIPTTRTVASYNTTNVGKTTTTYGIATTKKKKKGKSKPRPISPEVAVLNAKKTAGKHAVWSEAQQKFISS